MSSGKPPVTFVLPGDGRSGGVRVTVIMGNLLTQRGYNVRIAIPKSKKTFSRTLLDFLALIRAKGTRTTGWLHEFGGRIEVYDDLDKLFYRDHEVVIAVGTYTIASVKAMRTSVLKVRFNHGFPAIPKPQDLEAWKGTMPTITVSETLVPSLQNLTNGSVWGVVPNGIDTSLYFPDGRWVRDGIGAVYNGHPNKAPTDLISVLRNASTHWPNVPQRVFGTELRPKGLAHTSYTRLPSVEEARMLYSQSLVWLLTSRTEGLPGVVLEAMACGCVVISTDNEGSLEVIKHGVNGLIVRRGDLDAFAAQIGKVLQDSSFGKMLSIKALETVDGYTWKRAADRMECFLQDLPNFSSRVLRVS